MLQRTNSTMTPSELVAKIASELGKIETGLHRARTGIGKVESLLKEARKLGMARDTETMIMISRLGAIAGSVASAEENIYMVHGDMTARAIGDGIDTGGPLAVLAKWQPEITPRDGGGGR